MFTGRIDGTNQNHALTNDEVHMPATRLLRFSENFETMTYPECLAFIERSRRQIDRLGHLPQSPGVIDKDELASIRQGLDELERNIRSHPACPHS